MTRALYDSYLCINAAIPLIGQYNNIPPFTCMTIMSTQDILRIWRREPSYPTTKVMECVHSPIPRSV